MLTPQEKNILRLNAVGLSAKEIAYNLNIATVTVQNHIKSIKEKLDLQKSTELVAFYWCKYFGSSLEQQKKSILITLTVLILIQTLTLNQDIIRRFRRVRKNEIEFVS